jgi:alanine dehydrogenase
MKIGVPKEIKDKEKRVALTPTGAQRLIAQGNRVCVESGAGQGAGYADEAYRAAGAEIVTAADAWAADLVVKVKEPLASEYGFLRGQMLFTFLHLAGAPRALTEALLDSGTVGLAYETLEDAAGRLPLLAPMSAIAGNLAALVGAYYLASTQGGKGVQLGQVMGTRHGQVLVLGDGVVGRHAARTASGLGAEVRVAGLHEARAAELRREIGEEVAWFLSTPEHIDDHIRDADLVVGAVLHHGARAEAVVTESMVRSMEAGSVIVDVSIDQGGCVATSRPTSHSDPVFVEHGIIHYCVTNMPGAYPRTATRALTDATLPYVEKLAASGLDALRSDPGFGKTLNTRDGYLTCRPVAESLDLLARYREERCA